MDDIVDPEYWVHEASRLKVGDIIEVHNSDFSIDCDLRVVELDPAGQWVRVMRRGDKPTHALSQDSIIDNDGYRIDNDPVQGWRIMRGRDMLASRLPDKAAAIKKRDELKAPVRKAG
jgi:hypothetical protein